jgi:nucleotide-binding universal stress UspA family protein
MFSKIIVGIDGSDGGRDAFALACDLADETTELVLVSSFPYDLHANRGTSRGYEDLVRTDITKALDQSAAGDPRCSVVVVADGSPGRALHHEAQRNEADLIAIGSCHRGAVGRVLLGDVSRVTLHGAPCPVAVAPQGYRNERKVAIETIGVGYNDTVESKAALELAVMLAEAGQSTLRILTAVATPAVMAASYAYAYDWNAVHAEALMAATRNLETAFQALDVPAETETIDDDPGKALENLSEHVDVVVAGSRGWGATHRVVLGSTTDYLVHHAHCPVLIVPVHGGPAARASEDVVQTHA